MSAICLRILVAILTFSIGLTVNSFVTNSIIVEKALTPIVRVTDHTPVKSHEYLQPPTTFDYSIPTEIILRRVHTWCEGCADREIVLRTEGSDQFEPATVTELDLNTRKVRRGKLYSYYPSLVKYIELQNYFEFADRYGMGWTDVTVVTTTVTIGNKRKTIKTGHEGEVPLQLWGIHRAIDGVLSHVTWDPVSDSRP